MTELKGDQIAVSATDDVQDGKRVFLVWLLCDEDEKAYQARLPADTPGQAVNEFCHLLLKHRMRNFTWRGKVSTTLKVVK